MIGLIGRKKGMGSIYDSAGKHTAVTVIEVGPCPVVQVKTEKKDSYNALQLGFGSVRPKLVNKPKAGHFTSRNIEPTRHLKEFRDFSGDYKEGDMLTVDMFNPGDYISVTGISKGRGFAGVIKRFGFNRPNQSHGTHEAFRGPGSIGNASDPARVWPGKRMAGRMGNDRVTVKNLKVLKIDSENGLLLVKGAVPGKNGGIVQIAKIKGAEVVAG